MDLDIDELEHIYEALNVSIADVVHLETTPAHRAQVAKELRDLARKISNEIDSRQTSAATR